MEAVLERGDDPEVAASSPQPPEQLGMLAAAGQEPFAAGGHHLAGAQVVGGQPVLAHEPADAAAEGEPADPGVADDPASDRQPGGLGGVDDGALDLSGQPELVRAFSRWFTWSHFAPIVRAASARRASL
jgi:hypothetical protein